MAAPTDVYIQISATDGAAPLAVAVTPHATDEDASVPEFSIDYGDGATVTGAPAEEPLAHVYTSPGQYTITASAAVEGFPPVEAEPVVVTVAAPNNYPEVLNPGGVCQPWITVNDLCSVTDSGAMALRGQAAVNAATRWLNDITGGRWSGPCTSFLRPNVGDAAGNCDPAGYRRRGRQPIDLTLWIAPPILEVVELRVDGQVIDPKWYYIRDGKLHASTGWDDADSPLIPWPAQNDDRQDGAVDTWDLTVRHAPGPPETLREAAAVLACEILRLVSGDERCALPKTAVSVSRDGVTMTFQPPVRGRSGIKFVDSQIDLYGPEGIGIAPRRILNPADPTRVQVSRY